jgi:hypothetical protein
LIPLNLGPSAVLVFHSANADQGVHQDAVSCALEAAGAVIAASIMPKVARSQSASASRESGLPLAYIYRLFHNERRSSQPTDSTSGPHRKINGVRNGPFSSKVHNPK